MIVRMSDSALVTELQNIGVHAASIPIFQNRAVMEPIKIYGLSLGAANILKQEALSSGADCAVHCGCVVGTVKTSDAILLGNRRQYKELLRKLAPMQFLGLPALCKELQELLVQPSPKTILRDGRILDYQKMMIMGIVNITPDSLYGGSCRQEVDDVLRLVGQMIEEGADMIDVGAESSRPGSLPLSAQEEWSRLAPVLGRIKQAFPQVILSVDTYKASIAKQSIEEGADIINDISGGADPLMGEVLANTETPIILMHLNANPTTMQPDMPVEEIDQVWSFLKEKRDGLVAAGVKKEKIILDPGYGFGKSLDLNLALLNRLQELISLGQPVLIGASRKGSIGKVLGGLPIEERLVGTLALSCQAVVEGAHIVRVHDVKENWQAVRMLEAVRK